MRDFRFAEFFSGGGMARAGLGPNWKCMLANDINPMKCAVYRENWEANELFEGDISELPSHLLHQVVDLYWASSPCQDFSLAGAGKGLSGKKSSVFYPWLKQVTKAVDSGFAPKMIAFENVTGLMSANSGKDFALVVNSIVKLGYLVGATIVDARDFLPQSRPRLFVIGIRKDLRIPTKLIGRRADNTNKLIDNAFSSLSDISKESWVWWKLPLQNACSPTLSSIVQVHNSDQEWFSAEKTHKLIQMMNETHRMKLFDAQKSGILTFGTVYKRGRPNETGRIVQRAELRLDGIAGCLRTPGGGSSRQILMMIQGDDVKARLLSRREAANLMGLPKDYILPSKYNDAYLLAGDGVAVPVVRYLAETIFEPVLMASLTMKAA